MTLYIADVLLERPLFSSFTFNQPASQNTQEPVSFSIDLNSFVETIGLTGVSSLDVPLLQQHQQHDKDKDRSHFQKDATTIARLSYLGTGNPFILTIQDEIITETCKFQTYIDNSDTTDSFNGLNISKEQIVLEIILKGDIMWEALKDLEEIKTESIIIYAKQQQKRNHNRNNSDEKGQNGTFAMISKGEMGSSKIVFPNVKSILEVFMLQSLEDTDDDDENENGNGNGNLTTLKDDNNEITIVGSYKFTLFDKIRKAVRLATRVRIRRDANGLMSIQLLCPSRREVQFSDAGSFNNNTFIEFIFLQLIEENQQSELNTTEELMKNAEDGKMLEIGITREESGEQQNIIDITQFDRDSTSGLLFI